MKNAPQYSQKMKKLFAALKKGAEKPKKSAYEDVVESLIFAALCQESPESAAKQAMKKLQSHFVDHNDLRVARAEEIIELIGSDIMNADKAAGRITSLLNAIFQKYDSLLSENLMGSGKKNIKEVFDKLNGMTDFIRNYVFLSLSNGHSIPLTDKMMEYLKANELIDPQWDNAQIDSFLEKQVSATEAYSFYTLIRHDSELANPKAAQILSENKKASSKSK